MDNQTAATLMTTMNTPATSAHSLARDAATPASGRPDATERRTGLIPSAARPGGARSRTAARHVVGAPQRGVGRDRHDEQSVVAEATARGPKARDVVVEMLDDVEQEHDVSPPRLDDEVLGQRALARVETGSPGHREQSITG